MAKTIKVIIKPDGKKEVKLDGFQGVGCAAVLDAFTKGDKIITRIKQPEYRTKTAITVCQ